MECLACGERFAPEAPETNRKARVHTIVKGYIMTDGKQNLNEIQKSATIHRGEVKRESGDDNGVERGRGVSMAGKHLLALGRLVIMPVLFILFAVTDHYGVWDTLRGLNNVEAVAKRMNLSYQEAQRQYRPGDKEWSDTVALIKRYTKADIPLGRDPLVLTRSQAIASSKLDLGGGISAEWTAPNTPIMFLYKELPLPSGSPDVVVVGDIADLFTWVDKSKTDFRFYIQNVLLAIFSVTLGIFAWRLDHQGAKQGNLTVSEETNTAKG
jgi:hypothetical protein